MRPLSAAALCMSVLAFAGDAVAADLDTQLAQRAEQIEAQVIAWRRDIHANPELSNREFRTAALVAEHLRRLGMEVTTEVAHTGVVGLLRGGAAGPVVALRADMDALPVVEKTGLPFASKVKSEYEGREVGVMHACGHDNHVAVLMGVAEVLTSMRKQLPGTVKFIFQPAEEGPPKGEDGGAKMMIAEGALQNPTVDAIFGLHFGQYGATGTVSYRERGFMASAQRFDIHIQGVQAHGARPWAGIDPVVVGAEMVTALQTIVARQIDVTQHPAVVTVGAFQAGVRNNIVPESARLSGTIRTFDPAVKLAIHEKIRRIAHHVAQAHGASVEVEIDPGVPVTYNDPDLAQRMVPSLQKVYGPEFVFRSQRVTGAEDFSFFQQRIPGFFFFVGARPDDIAPQDAVSNHSPYFTADEAALRPAVRAMSQLALDYLRQGASES
ncbi:MAG: amidohydrolase [Pseudomonadota bacterium]